MSFVQAEFPILLAIVFALYWAASGRRVLQNVVLLVASACFYGWVSPWWLILLFGSATVDFTMGQMMVRSPAYKKVWLGISLGANIGVLLYFKYFDFFIENLVFALTEAGISTDLRVLNILLPAGISFYTFQTMSYTLDIYRGELRPRTSYLDYVVFVSFFPQLVAGPIERASRLLPQFEVARRFSLQGLRSGFGLAMYGAFKKMVIADNIAPYVDKVFLLDEPSGPLVWAATVGFMLQLYTDFSGYTDLARGTARMLGIDLVRNFNEPYMAASTPEFWQRWHMSLSSWIRDYLLTPLLGNADVITRVRFAVAVTVTMVVMGAWHGAGWNFIAFGFFHSFCILAYVLAQRNLPDRVKQVRYGRPLAIAVQQVVVGGLSALMFREPSLARFQQHLSQPLFVASDDEWRAAIALFGLAAVLSVPLAIEHVARRTALPALERSPWYLPVQSAVWSVFAALMLVSYRTTTYDFIYFQF